VIQVKIICVERRAIISVLAVADKIQTAASLVAGARLT